MTESCVASTASSTRSTPLSHQSRTGFLDEREIAFIWRCRVGAPLFRYEKRVVRMVLSSERAAAEQGALE